MDENDFYGVLVVGSLLSLVIQAIKKKFGTESSTTRGLTIGLSVAVGTGYWYLERSGWKETVLGILAAASAFYALFLKEDRV